MHRPGLPGALDRLAAAVKRRDAVAQTHRKLIERADRLMTRIAESRKRLDEAEAAGDHRRQDRARQRACFVGAALRAEAEGEAMKYTLKGYGVRDERGRVDYCDKDAPGLQLWRCKRDACGAMSAPGDTLVRVTVTVEVEE